MVLLHPTDEDWIKIVKCLKARSRSGLYLKSISPRIRDIDKNINMKPNIQNNILLEVRN